jgi:hypothetical protein
MPILGTYASQFSGKSFSSYESIASATGTGSTTITFNSIPSTYAHLQLRCVYKSTDTGSTSWVAGNITLNNDSGNNYTDHRLFGDGSSVSADGNDTSSSSRPQIYGYTSSATYSNRFGVSIVDIHDYASTTKNKTIRIFNGLDFNGSGYQGVILRSSLWVDTSAINRLDITVQGGLGNFASGTSFALYGIKGA